MIPIASHDFEQSCIVSALLDPNTIPKLLEMSADDFYYVINRIMFVAIKELTANDVKIDGVTMMDYLRDKPAIIEAGGDSYIAELYQSYASASGFEGYRDKVLELSRRRQLKKIYRDATQELENSANIDDIALEVEGAINNINIIEPYERLADKDLNWITDTGTCIKTGFCDIDSTLGGFYEDELSIIAARPGMGKSAFALCLALNMIATKKVMFFSLEMSVKQIMQRIMANLTSMDMYKFRKDKLTDHERLESLAHLEEFFKISDNLIIYDKIIRLSDIINKSKQENPDIIIVDYLQLVVSNGQLQRHLQIGEISRSLKQLSKQLQIPVIALSQLNRAVENRVDMIPRLSDLRESGSLEQDADMVAFLHGEMEQELRNIIIAKNRQGKVGKIDMWFRQKLMQFQNQSSVN